jgi:hypothetical protein
MPHKRFIDVDINRIFPGNVDGNHEEKLAHNLLLQLKDIDIVIDIHTTTSKTKPFTICTKHTELAKYSPLPICVIMGEKIAKGKSLIDHCNGFSLEFNEHENIDFVVQTIHQTVHNIKTQHKNNPQYFECYDVLADPHFVGENFVETTYQNETFYPVLFGKREYTQMTCLKARKICDEKR